MHVAALLAQRDWRRFHHCAGRGGVSLHRQPHGDLHINVWVLVVAVSVLPMGIGWLRRRKASPALDDAAPTTEAALV
ncbi:hypothetical protein [uncultured Corynebacterium sp.]|uniref:hypothetical protein n=1 Tax=uncultured Corynebacterium sp. TaxID=159447 RepID=UPI0025D89A70|nr:hypothetical protein [uncultured Corynebacterium sp.]